MKATVKNAHYDMPPGSVIIQGSRAYPHVALWFRDRNENLLCLSMMSRGLTCEGAFSPPAKFVESAASQQQVEDLCDIAERFWQKNSRSLVPFGFDLRGVSISENGDLNLQGEGQLTCASLIMLLFEGIGAPLLVREQWNSPDEQRQRDDEAARMSLAAQLRPRRDLPATGCARFRPEEVAAASGLPDRPVGFEVAAKAGQDVLNHLPS